MLHPGSHWAFGLMIWMQFAFLLRVMKFNQEPLFLSEIQFPWHVVCRLCGSSKVNYWFFSLESMGIRRLSVDLNAWSQPAARRMISCGRLCFCHSVLEVIFWASRACEAWELDTGSCTFCVVRTLIFLILVCRSCDLVVVMIWLHHTETALSFLQSHLLLSLLQSNRCIPYSTHLNLICIKFTEIKILNMWLGWRNMWLMDARCKFVIEISIFWPELQTNNFLFLVDSLTNVAYSIY